jgi:hypothetical protein
VFHSRQPAYLKPVIIYVCLAFFLDATGNILGYFKDDFGLPLWLQRNTFLYNIHSIIRFTCFSLFFIRLEQPFLVGLKKIVPMLSLLFVLINFLFFENFNDETHLSGRLLATEAFLLLLYCLQYFLYRLREDEPTLGQEPHFWVTTGLSIYVVINFFIFLFYVPMVESNPRLADKMWDFHNIAYIIFCLFIAKAFYVPDRHK